MSEKGQNWIVGILSNSRPRERWIITIGLAFSISIVHLLSDYLQTTHWLFIHSILTKLYFLPVLIIALWDGERQAYKMSFIVTLFFMPYSVLHWSGPPEGRLSILAEIALIWVVSAVAGKLADKLRDSQVEKSRLQTARDVSKVLEIINRQILVDYEASMGLAKSLQSFKANGSNATSTEQILLNRLERLGSHLKNLGALTIPESRIKQKYGLLQLLEKSKRELSGRDAAINILQPDHHAEMKVTIDTKHMMYAVQQIYRSMIYGPFDTVSPITVRVKKLAHEAVVQINPHADGENPRWSLMDLLSHPERGYAFSLALSIIRSHGGTLHIESTSPQTKNLHLQLPLA